MLHADVTTTNCHQTTQSVAHACDIVGHGTGVGAPAVVALDDHHLSLGPHFPGPRPIAPVGPVAAVGHVGPVAPIPPKASIGADEYDAPLWLLCSHHLMPLPL